MEYFQVLHGRLVLQHNEKAWKLWHQDVEGNLKKADANWPTLSQQKAADERMTANDLASTTSLRPSLGDGIQSRASRGAPTRHRCGDCGFAFRYSSQSWFFWLAARLPKRMLTRRLENRTRRLISRPKEGVDLVKGQWRYSDTKIIEVDFKAAGPDKQPTGKPIKTYDFTPHAGGADFDDSKWEMIDPTTLDARRSTGRLCFNWYRINITIPDAVGDVDLAGATAVFETSIDDYAEIWVDGELSRALGQSGGSVVKGWNAANRLDHQPQRSARAEDPARDFRGQRPALESADQLHLHARGEARVLQRRRRAGRDHAERGECRSDSQRSGDRRDRCRRIQRSSNSPKAFKFTEGPVWDRKGGFLLFSDPNTNTIYKYSPEGNGAAHGVSRARAATTARTSPSTASPARTD